MSLLHGITKDKVQQFMDTYANCGFFNGSVLVAYQGNIILSKGYGFANRERNLPNNPQTKFRIASLTKAFTAMAIMQLEEKGLLQVDETISKFIPDYPFGEQITIHHLLTHSSGITNHTNLPHFDLKIRPFDWTTENLINEFSHYELEFKAGERNAYSNSGYVLLTLIIERVSGQTYSEYLQEHIFKRIGMNNTGTDLDGNIVLNYADGYILNKEFVHTVHNNLSTMMGAGALYSTVEDLYLWDQALYTNTLVSLQTLKRIFTPYFASYGGYGWDISQVKLNGILKRRTVHFGDVEGFGAFISRYVEDELTVIVLSNTMIAPVEVINDKLAAIVFGSEIPLPIITNNIDLDMDDIQNLVGEYLKINNDNEKLSFSFEEHKLFVSQNDSKYEIHAVLKNDFVIEFVTEFIDERFSFLITENKANLKVHYTDANGNSDFYRIMDFLFKY